MSKYIKGSNGAFELSFVVDQVAFIPRTVLPGILDLKTISCRLLVDHNFLQILADGGVSDLSNLFFVEQPFDVFNLKS